MWRIPLFVMMSENQKGNVPDVGAKWFEHKLDTLPENEKESAKQIQKEKGIN